MAARMTRASGLAAVLLTVPAQAATVTFNTRETSGRTLDSVVVTLLPVGRGALPPPRPASIEQVRKTFVPLVSVVQTGAAVDFPNNDTVRHHVYSFSASKVFELKLYAGTPARPVVFDKPGVVVLGCNIHDRMVAYILVVDTPWFAVSGDDGSAKITDLPPGDYMLQTWHPRRLGMSDLPPRPIRVSADLTESVTVDLKP
jgi:hypothetical protein